MQESTSNTERFNVLMVEDNRDDVEILEHYLGKIPHKTLSLECCGSLKAGLKRLGEAAFDIVFLDLSLPDSTGLDSLLKTHKVLPSVPVVVLTGTDDTDLAVRALAAGAQDYLVKGQITAATLQRSIDYAMARQRGSEVSEFLASLVESSVDAIVGRSLDNKIVSWNKAAETIFGYAKDEVIGRNVEFLFPSERLHERADLLIVDDPAIMVNNFETIRVRKDGSRVAVSLSIAPIRNHQGLVTGSVVVVRDISKQRAVEEAVREKNQSLQLALQISQIGVWSCIIKTREIYYDDRICEFFGVSRADFVGPSGDLDSCSSRRFFDFVHPDDRDMLKQEIESVLHERRAYHCEYRIVRPDGSVRELESKGEIFYDDDGEPSHLTGVCMDVTEKKQMQQKAREATRRREQIARAIVHHAPVGIVTLDVDLVITDLNEAFARMVGREVGQVLLTSLSTIVPTDIFESAVAAINSGKPLQVFRLNVNIPLEHSEVAYYWDLHLWPVMGPKAQLNGAVLQVINCTDMVVLERQKDDFVAAVAHDIKNPLIGAERVLDALCTSAAKNKAEQSSLELLNMLRDSNYSLLSLVQNLVDIYRYDTVGYPIKASSINMQTLLDGTIRHMKYFADSKHVAVNFSGPEEPVLLTGDATGIERVLTNILHNAVKFSREAHSVEVSLAVRDDQVQVAVTDSGDGIGEEEQKKLFQRFSQAAGGKNLGCGSGLGLYLSKQIIAAHGGNIVCKSREDAGSTFIVTLPLGLTNNVA